MEPSGKRARTSEATETALRSGLPARRVARLSQALGGPSTTRHEMDRALEDLATLRTVYGPMTGKMSVPLVGGGELDIMYVNPFALLHHSCSVSEHMRGFLTRMVASSPVLHIVMYVDGVRAGNQLHSDRSRTFESYFWTFAETPCELKARTSTGWYLLAHIPGDVEIRGGSSHVACKLMEVFWGCSDGAWNFQTGCRLPMGGRANSPSEGGLRCVGGRRGCSEVPSKFQGGQRYTPLSDVHKLCGSLRCGRHPCVSLLDPVGAS